MAVVSDPSLSTYNGYFSLAEVDLAITELDGVRDIAGWDALTQTQQENLIVSVTGEANRYNWRGQISSIVIAPEMKWPRSDVEYTNGVEIPDTSNPSFLLDYLAFRILEFIDNPPETITSTQQVQKNKVGSLEQTFFENDSANDGIIAAEDQPSYQIIQPYLSLLSNNQNVKFLSRF